MNLCSRPRIVHGPADVDLENGPFAPAALYDDMQINALYYCMQLQRQVDGQGLIDVVPTFCHDKAISIPSSMNFQHACILSRLSQYPPCVKPTHGPHPSVLELQAIIRENVMMMLGLPIHKGSERHASKPAVVAVSGSREMTSSSHITGNGQAYERRAESHAIERNLFESVFNQLPCVPSLILQGDCYKGGADEHAVDYANHYNIASKAYPPEKVAGWAMTKRNRQMVRDADVVVAFWDGKQERSGTLNFMQGVYDDPSWVVWMSWPNYRGEIVCVFRAARMSWLLR